jgi:hypothetical protein
MPSYFDTNIDIFLYSFKYFENFLYSSNEENLISPDLYRINCGIPIIGISSPFENSGS